MILRCEIRDAVRRVPPRAVAGRFVVVSAAPHTSAPQHPIGRIPVLDVRPCVDDGARPAKAVVDEAVRGHGHRLPRGPRRRQRLGRAHRPHRRRARAADDLHQPRPEHLGGHGVAPPPPAGGPTGSRAGPTPTAPGSTTPRSRSQADVDTELMLEEGALRARAGPRRGRRAPPRSRPCSRTPCWACATPPDPPPCALKAGTDPSVERELAARPLRDHVTPSADLAAARRARAGPVRRLVRALPAQRGRDLRREGAPLDHRHAPHRRRAAARHRGDGLRRRLPHPDPPDRARRPRRAPTTPSTPAPRTPAAPTPSARPTAATTPSTPTWAPSTTSTPSSPSRAGSGMEVAMDLALQCSPDHPWVDDATPSGSPPAPTAPSPTPRTRRRSTRTSTRSTSTTTRPASTPRCARSCRCGSTTGSPLFRVDNPHTKPVEFWQWLIADVAKDHPEVIWLAEAFTKPAMMHTLGKVGFQQSYTYYTWRNSAVRPARVPHRAVRRGRGLHAPVVLAHHARHPHALHAVRRPGRLEAAGGARGHPRADLRHLRRLRADGARRPARRRGADRQREVRVQEPPLGGLRARRQQGRAVAGRLAHHDQRRPAGAPRAAPAARHPRSTTSTTRTSSPSPSAAGCPTAPTTSWWSSPTSTRTRPAPPRCGSTWPPSGLEPGDSFEAHDLVTDERWTWQRDNYVRLGPEVEPVHVVAVRRPW